MNDGGRGIYGIAAKHNRVEVPEPKLPAHVSSGMGESLSDALAGIVSSAGGKSCLI